MRPGPKSSRFAKLAFVPILLGASASAQGVPSLTRIATIGCAECDGPTQFGTIADLALTTDGDVLVVGHTAPMLRLFDRTGKVRWTVGAEGRGPGEFTRPIGAVAGASGILVVDMTQRRLSRFSTDGRFLSSAALGGFPSAVGGEGRTGGLAVVLDDFRGGKPISWWGPADSARRIGRVPDPVGTTPGTISIPSIAVAPNGEVATLPDGNTYRIVVLGPDGSERRTLTRDVPRVARTTGEIAALERVRARARERAAAERPGGGGGAPPPSPPRMSGSDELKPHIAIGGLRYDDTGRLWVRTMRGDEASTVFDLFAPDGRFVGELRLPHAVGAFAVRGRWLAADTEMDDGWRAVTLWEIR